MMMELYFKFKFITEVILAGIGIIALIVYILLIFKGAKFKK